MVAYVERALDDAAAGRAVPFATVVQGAPERATRSWGRSGS